MVELEQPRFICHVTTTVITSLAESERLKEVGNESFRRGSYVEAAALTVAPSTSASRAVYYGNKAACHMHLAQYLMAIEACSQALKINGQYVKVWLRRSAAYEKLNELDKALEDAKRVLDIESDHRGAKKQIERLNTKKAECDATVKEEMIGKDSLIAQSGWEAAGKLKDLGNTVLGKFGVSLDDFKAERDPETGSYNLSLKK